MNSLRNRILFFFTLFALMASGAVYLSSRSTAVVSNAADIIATHHLPMVQAMSGLEVALQRQDNALYRYMATGQKQWRDVCEKERNNYTRWFLKAQAEANEDIEKDKLAEIDDLYVQYENETRYVLLSLDRSSPETWRLLKSADQYLTQIQTMVDEIQSLREGMTVVYENQIRDTIARHSHVGIYFISFLLFLFTLLTYYLVNYLVRPLGLLHTAIRDFTRGKTDIVVPPIGKDELGELQEAFNEMSRELMVERRRLKTESQSDALTGLFNMRYFRSQFGEEFSRSQRYGRPLTLLMIDVDFFKAYNDRNGHPAGDIVLKEVARILIRNVRGTDIVARYGGEEFVVLLPETPIESAATVAEKIRKTVNDHHFPFKDAGSEDRLTVSVGVASYPDSRITSDQDLIETADRALYNAKRNGRNQVVLFAAGELVPAKNYIRRDAAPVSKLPA